MQTCSWIRFQARATYGIGDVREVAEEEVQKRLLNERPGKR